MGAAHPPRSRSRPITTSTPAHQLCPPLSDLAGALNEAAPFLAAADAARGEGYVNHEGGDVGGHGTERSLYRHVANYLAAAEVGARAGVAGAVLDVGSGTGALAAWVAHRIRARLHLVDRDPAVRAVALAAFPHVTVHPELTDVPSRSAALVMGMEVVEHVAPARQPGFVRALVERVAPGGLLVLSTPDESRYVGGWSGYAPHVGPVDADRLRTLLEQAAPGIDATAAPDAMVWRLEGDPFHAGLVRRMVQPVANRLWTRLGPLVEPVTHR
ncbi:MAG: class I SAM-dependent methyltransferase, partial [Egibacteraceae bacterium]